MFKKVFSSKLPIKRLGFEIGQEEEKDKMHFIQLEKDEKTRFGSKTYKALIISSSVNSEDSQFFIYNSYYWSRA